ncbi:M48 family metallopeptidase [bacterium]|nr:M48 family metallopeptidase [bacterium]
MNEIKIDKLIRSKRRTIGLQITQDATLIVRAPLFAALHDVQRVVDKKRQWIITKQAMARLRMAGRKQKAFIDGELFLFLGEAYKLACVKGQRTPGILKNTIQVADSGKEDISRQMVAFYKCEAFRIISERTEVYAHTAGVKYTSVRISSARKRWGSCGPSGSLNFNWRLIMAPMFVLDYVVVHELAHIKIRNHSKHFWNCVAEMMPDYRNAEQWLKDNHWELDM